MNDLDLGRAPEEAGRVDLTFQCPRCRKTNRQPVTEGAMVRCESCGWSRTAMADEFERGKPTTCVVCGCHDLWRQKGLSQPVGLLMVGTGIVLSTVAYALWRPMLALAILMAFALFDAVLFFLMRDVLVCYRCGARHGGFEPLGQASFNLELNERYRQERLRVHGLSGRSS